MEIFEEKRKELREVYRLWEKQLRILAPQFFPEGSEDGTCKYSFPYFMGIPEDWYSRAIRIMIVGEEGAGEKTERLDLERAQEWNLNFMNSQIGKSQEYQKQSGQFWGRFRRIADQYPDAAICWNNIDKIHERRKGNGRLRNEDRILLHHTEIKILQEIIRILNPTHIVFFGWYGISLQAELPEVFRWLYPGGLNDNSRWKGGKPLTYGSANKYYVFSYHPGWRGKEKPKDYEESALKELKAAVEVFFCS